VPVKCPACSKAFQLNADPLPEKIACPHCGAVITVKPKSLPSAIIVAKLAPTPPPLTVIPQLDEEDPEPPRRKRRRRIEEDSPLEPMPRRREQTVRVIIEKARGTHWLVSGCIAPLLGLGAIAVFCGFGVDGCFKALDKPRLDEAKRVAALTPEQQAEELERKQKLEEARRNAEVRRQEIIEGRRVSYEKYNRVKTGMLYKEVAEILGRNGEELSRVEIAGLQTVIFAWKNDDFSNMNVTFQNARVAAKAQFGLK
jgi:DNA-directed RNA polymerase subunit RPC12/RpoP